MDVDNLVRLVRPEPEPSANTAAAARAALNNAMRTSGPSDAVRLEAPEREAEVVGLGEATVRMRREAFVAASVAAAVALIAGAVAVVALVRDDTSATVAAGRPDAVAKTAPATTSPEIDPPSVPASTGSNSTSARSAPAGLLTCGADFPFGVEFPGLGLALGEGPLFASVPVDEGQLVKHVAGNEYSIEIRWPASARADRADRETKTVRIGVGAYLYEERSVVEIFVNQGTDALVGGPGDVVPFARFTGLEYSADNPVCMIFEMRIVDDTGTASLLMTLDRPGDGELTGGPVGDNDPVVIATTEVDTGPTEAARCEGGIGNVPPNIDHPISSGPVASTPLDALIGFLDGPGGEGLARSGYVEFLAADGSVTYARPIEAGSDEYVTSIRVEPAASGWATTHLTASGC